MSKDDPAGVMTWRPTADSFRNLVAFWATLGCVAAAGVAFRGEATTVATMSASVLLAAAAVTALFGRRRVITALHQPEHPSLGNWPPSPAQRAHDLRAGWVNAGKAVAIALVLGVAGSTVPALGFGLAGAGLGGAVGSAALWRLVRHYEDAEGVTVLTAGRAAAQRAPRAPLTFGVVARPGA